MKITIQNVTKFYGAREILNDFSLDVNDGTRLCVCGPNGCGKSTLVSIMAGESPPDSGRIITPKNCRIGYVQQILNDKDLDTELLAWVQSALPDWNDFWQEWEQSNQDEAQLKILMDKQHELESMYGYNPEQKAQTVLSGLGFSQNKWNMQLRKLSGGWRERAKLARVLIAGADVLLLDEPTNHLDLDAVEWLEDFLLHFKGSLIFVAHDRVFMDHISTHVLYLGHAKPVFRKATFTQFLQMQEEVEEQRERETKKLMDDLDHKMDFIRRFKAKASKARQAGSRQKQAKKLEKELENHRPENKRRDLAFKWPDASRSEKIVLSIADLAFQFPDGASLWPPLTFTLFRGQRIGLVGPNGCGKSTLLKILAGKIPKTSGQLQMSALTKLGYYSQQQDETLKLTNTVLGEMRRLSDPKTSEEELMSVLGLFLLGHSYFERTVSALSGGERSRLTLALLFLARCNLLVLDEPTNHLDLESREALLDALESFNGSLMIVAHDRHLLTHAVDEIWEVTPKGLIIHEQGFEAYEAKRQHDKAHEKIQQKSNKNATPTTANTGLSRDELKQIKREQAEQRNILSKQLNPLQKQYDALKTSMENNLDKQTELEALLADPDVYADEQKTATLLKDFHATQMQAEKELEELERLEIDINILKEKTKALD